jgi:hypothetical protein
MLKLAAVLGLMAGAAGYGLYAYTDVFSCSGEGDQPCCQAEKKPCCGTTPGVPPCCGTTSECCDSNALCCLVGTAATAKPDCCADAKPCCETSEACCPATKAAAASKAPCCADPCAACCDQSAKVAVGGPVAMFAGTPKK